MAECWGSLKSPLLVMCSAGRPGLATRMSVERWGVWRANLDPVVDAEQELTCPVLVVSRTSLNDTLPVVNVPPIRSRKAGRRIYPNETCCGS